MKIKEYNIEWNYKQWILNNQRSVFWCERRVLLIADLHLGKDTHFRQHGIPISSQVNNVDIARLCSLLEYYNPLECWILGDFIHSKLNDSWKNFQQITHQFSHTKFSLIKGNHDHISDVKLNKIGLTDIVQYKLKEGVLFIHEGKDSALQPTISGHLHPGVRIPMGGKSIKKLPAFLISPTKIILPAFSTFSGFNDSNIDKDMSIFVFNQDGIFKMESCWLS